MLRVRKSLEGHTLGILPFHALLPGLLARMILESLVLALSAVLFPRVTWVTLLPGLLARMILEVRCPREALGVLRVHSRRADTEHANAGEGKGPTYASLMFPRRLVQPSQLRLQVRAIGILDCVR